ncbi:MAG TPA: TolC family protein [Blastocatellia bacterium]|nr:TolC family protein [Blastocatellia bacterium]
MLNLLGATPEQVTPSLIAQERAVNALPIVKASLKPDAAPDVEDFASLRNAPLQLVFTFDDRPIAQSRSELRAIALRERPDVQAAQNLNAAAFKNISLAQAQRVRDISVGMEFQRVGPDQSVGATVSIPLFRYNNHQADVGQAQALQQSAAAQLKQVETQAITDVEKAYQAYLVARRTLDLFNSQNLTQMDKLRSIAAYSFKEGASSLLELLDAQRSYNQAMTAYNQARSDYQMALWQLEQAIGKPLR